MAHVLNFEGAGPPWVLDDTWQHGADASFKSLALHGYLVVHLGAECRHQAALQAGYDLAGLTFGLPGVKTLSSPGPAVGRRGLDCEEVLTYRSGPWPSEGALTCEQHELLHKAMAAAQDVCVAVLKCVAASRGVRLPPASLQGLIERPPLNPQKWSASMLQALLYRPAANAEAAPRDPPTHDPCEAHVDPGLLTLVYAPGQSGVQVMDGYGDWQPVGPLGHDQVLLVAGLTLEHALCGLLRPGQYRVVTPLAGQPPHFSLAFKLRPAPLARVDLIDALHAAGHAVLANRYPPLTGDDMMNRFSITHRNSKGNWVAHSMRCFGPASATPWATAFATTGQWPVAAAAVESRHGMIQLTQADNAGDARIARDSNIGKLVLAGAAVELGHVREDPTIVLEIKTKYGRSRFFKANRFASLRWVFRAYSAQEGIPLVQCRFIVNGQLPDWERTPTDLGLESGRIIYVLSTLYGD